MKQEVKRREQTVSPYSPLFISQLSKNIIVLPHKICAVRENLCSLLIVHCSFAACRAMQ